MIQFLVANAAEILIAVGILGSLIEKVGTIAGKPALTKFGQRLEGLGTDLPKLVRGSRMGQ